MEAAVGDSVRIFPSDNYHYYSKEKKNPLTPNGFQTSLLLLLLLLVAKHIFKRNLICSPIVQHRSQVEAGEVSQVFAYLVSIESLCQTPEAPPSPYGCPVTIL